MYDCCAFLLKKKKRKRIGIEYQDIRSCWTGLTFRGKSRASVDFRSQREKVCWASWMWPTFKYFSLFQFILVSGEKKVPPRMGLGGDDHPPSLRSDIEPNTRSQLLRLDQREKFLFIAKNGERVAPILQ